MPFLRKNVASQYVFFMAWDTANSVGKTGDSGNFTLKWVKDGTSGSAGGTVTEVDATNAPGLYKYAPTQSETDCLTFCLHGKSSTANIVLQPASGGTDQGYFAALQADTDDLQTRLPAALVSGRIDASVGAMAADVVTASAIATDAIGSAELAASAASEIATAAAAAILQTPANLLNTDSNGCPVMRSLDSGLIRSTTAQGGSLTTVTLDAGASAVTSYYRGLLVHITAGTGAGQARIISAYNGTSKVATVDRSWATAPDNTSTFALVRADSASADGLVDLIWDEDISVHTAGNSAGQGISDMLSNLSLTLNRIGSFSASGVNTILGCFKALLSKTATLPSNIGGTFDPATDSVEAIRDRGDADWTAHQITTGTAAAGASGSITLDTNTASSQTDFYRGMWVRVMSGTGSGQIRRITAYNGSTGVATVARAWAVTPNAFSVYAVYAVDLDELSTVSTISTNVSTALTRLGSWTGTGVNTILGAFKAIASKVASAPSDIGGTFDPASDSVEAIRDRGDSAWVTGGGGGGTSVFTLSQVAATVDNARADAGALTAYRASTFSEALTGLGPLTGRSKLWVTCKYDLDNDADAAAVFQLEESGGLLRLNGAAATSSGGSVVVDDGTAGDITINLSAATTAALPAGTVLFYDVAILVGTTKTQKTAGTLIVQPVATLATS